MVKCDVCEFELFHPIVHGTVTTLALYDDARFRGRSILMLNEHYETIEELPTRLSNAYMEDIKLYVRVLKDSLQVSRVNVSILGNSISHVHSHLIPRYPENETFPKKSPWNDPRTLTVLDPADKEKVMEELFQSYEKNS